MGVPPPYDGIRAQASERGGGCVVGGGGGSGGGVVGGGGGVGVVVSKCDDADHSENSAVSRIVFVVSVIDAELWRDWG